MTDSGIAEFSQLEESGWPSTTDSVTINVHNLRETGNIYLGKGAEGLPFLLIPVGNEIETEPDQKLRHLQVTHGLSGTVRQDNGQELQFRCSVISCLDPEFIVAFLRFGSMLELVINRLPTSKYLASLVLKFADLLAFSITPSANTIRGFWAELFLVLESSDSNLMIEAWHRNANDSHDFVLEKERIEVKSCGSRIRKHDFSHDQLHATSEVMPLIASIQLRSANEPTIIEMTQILLSDIDITHENKQKLLELSIQTLGIEWMGDDTSAFDIEFARQSLRFYESSVLPQIPEPLPDGVSSLRYSIQIDDHIPQIDRKINPIARPMLMTLSP